MTSLNVLSKGYGYAVTITYSKEVGEFIIHNHRTNVSYPAKYKMITNIFKHLHGDDVTEADLNLLKEKPQEKDMQHCRLLTFKLNKFKNVPDSVETEMRTLQKLCGKNNLFIVTGLRKKDRAIRIKHITTNYETINWYNLSRFKMVSKNKAEKSKHKKAYRRGSYDKG